MEKECKSPEGSLRREEDTGGQSSSIKGPRADATATGGRRSEAPRSPSRPPKRRRDNSSEEEGSLASMVAVQEGEKGKRKKGGNRHLLRSREEREGDTIYSKSGRDEGVDEVASQGLRDWLADNSSSKMTAAQLSKHLLLQIWFSDGPLQNILQSSLEANWEGQERERNLLPLPLWPDVREEMRKVVNKGTTEEKAGDWRQRGDTKNKASKALRTEGLLIWTGLLTLSLNWMSSGGKVSRAVAGWGGGATAAQEKAMTRLWELAKTFVDDKLERGGVPRTPQHEWEDELKKMNISYTGEVCEKARCLTLEQILPGLPSVDHGGLVDILEVVDEKLAKKLQRPELLVRQEIVDAVPSPKVMCEEKEWAQVVEALYKRKLVKPVNKCPTIDGKPVLNGAFGVVKADKFTDSGKEVLRMIFDLRASNAILEQVDGDVKKLVGAAGFLKLTIQEGSTLLVSGEDLTAAFYLFRLPPQWADYMVLEKEVPWEVFSPGKAGKTRVGISVLPMGWNSAVGIMQAAHRQIALRAPRMGGAGLEQWAEIRRDSLFPDLEESPLWTIYLDDTTIIESVATTVQKTLEGKPAEEQERLRKAYQWWGIPTNASKALARCKKTERLGAVLDGGRGVLRTSTKRALDLVSLGSWLRNQVEVKKKALQIYAGKAVHILQFRRCLLSVMEKIFTEISKPGDNHRMSQGLVEEMLGLEAMLPAASFNLRAAIDPVVTASDASEYGGGACFASRLSRMGKEEVEKMMDGEQIPLEEPGDFRDEQERLVVISLFSGIGGLEHALRLAGVRPVYLLLVEKDPDCRRLLRREFPGAELFGDISLLTKEKLKEVIQKSEATGVLAAGGSPCQGLSRLSSERKHLEDARSALFFEMIRVFEDVKAIAVEEVMWYMTLVENVVADDEDIAEMSRALGVRPFLVDSMWLSRARRPRLFWLSGLLVAAPGVTEISREYYDELRYEWDEKEKMEEVLDRGASWPAGERDPSIRFPTFTRKIPRRQPPPRPAGLSSTTEEARRRWENHKFCYPPYTFNEEYMVKAGNELRPLNANEREKLMGFPQWSTLNMCKKIPETLQDQKEAEGMRCSAVGNAFHVVAVAALLDHALWSFGVKALKGHHAICKEAATARQRSRDHFMIQVQGNETPKERNLGSDTEVEEMNNHMEAMSIPAGAPRVSEGGRITEEDKKLATQLVAAFIKRQEYRGSDVRLDVGTIYRPDSFPRATVNPHRWEWHEAHAYKFHQEEHINCLELRAPINTVEWRCRRSAFGDVRFLHLSDSQVVLAVCVKGRSSSRQLNRLLKRLGALQVAAGAFPIYAWVETHLNPADKPSRRYAPKKK